MVRSVPGASIESWFALPNRRKLKTKEPFFMEKLLEKLNDYQRLIGCKLVYTLQNGQIIEVCFKEDNFLHLLGIHKLLDIDIVYQWLDKSNHKVRNRDVIRMIRSGRFNEPIIKNSRFFKEMKDRYDSFSYESLSTLAYTDAIINFNPSLANSKLLSDYILFEQDKNNEYNHMAIAIDQKTNNRYLESFFHEPNNKYIVGQTIVKVIKYQFIDCKGIVLFEDIF